MILSQSIKKNSFAPLRNNRVTWAAWTGIAALAVREGAIAAPLKRWRLAFPMNAGGEIEHVLNHTGGGWYTRNYTVFISHGSRTAFRSAYRGCDASLLHGAPMKSHGDLIHWVNTFDVFCDRSCEVPRTRVCDFVHGERVRKCKLLPRDMFVWHTTPSVLRDKAVHMANSTG